MNGDLALTTFVLIPHLFGVVFLLWLAMADGGEGGDADDGGGGWFRFLRSEDAGPCPRRPPRGPGGAAQPWPERLRAPERLAVRRRGRRTRTAPAHPAPARSPARR